MADINLQKNSDLLNEASAHLKAYLSRFGQSSAGWLFDRSLRYEEGTLTEGERIVVVGTARWEEDPDPMAQGGTYRERPRRLRIVPPSSTEPVLLSDEAELLRRPR